MFTVLIATLLVLSLLANYLQMLQKDVLKAKCDLLALHLESHVCRPTVPSAPRACERSIENEDEAWLAAAFEGKAQNKAPPIDFDIGEKTTPNLSKRG